MSNLSLYPNKRFNDFFVDFFGRDPFQNFSIFDDGKNLPSVNISDEDKKYVIEVAAPGLEKSDFNIDIEDDVITISSNKESKTEDGDGKNWTRREFKSSSFQRSFNLPDNVNIDEIKATHKNGILSIDLPKVSIDKTKNTKNINIL